MLPFLIGSGLLGLYQTIKGSEELSNLHKQKVPEYAETPEMRAARGRAEMNAQYGYSPEEKAAFRNNIAQDINTRSQRALDMGGGNLARVIGAQGNIDTMGAENKFAASDAELHRRNIQYADKFAQQVQAIQDRNIGEQLKQRYAAEQALGRGVQSGLTGLASTMNLAQIMSGGNGDVSKDVPKTTNSAPARMDYSMGNTYQNPMALASKYSANGINSMFGLPNFTTANNMQRTDSTPYNFNYMGIPSEYFPK